MLSVVKITNCNIATTCFCLLPVTMAVGRGWTPISIPNFTILTFHRYYLLAVLCVLSDTWHVMAYFTRHKCRHKATNKQYWYRLFPLVWFTAVRRKRNYASMRRVCDQFGRWLQLSRFVQEQLFSISKPLTTCMYWIYRSTNYSD